MWVVSLGESERSLWGGSLVGSGGVSGARSDHLSQLNGLSSPDAGLVCVLPGLC